MPNLNLLARMARITAVLVLLLPFATLHAADDRPLRIAVIGNSPPMSYTDSNGKLTGFNIEFAYALCESMKIRCELHPIPLDKVIDTVAAGEMDIAAVSLLATPERRQKVVFSKPYYRSLTIWLARPEYKPGAAKATVAVVRGSAQARHAEAEGWTTVFVDNHKEIPAALVSGRANATVVPMATAIPLMQNPALAPLELESTILSAPQITGDVCISISPKRPELRERIDAAIDQVKRDGRFDRINSTYLPFKLQ